VISLPGAGNGLMRGSLYVDRTGVYGGDLIVVTTAGEVWRVNTAGGTTKIADVGIHLEGVITVPNDVAKYGILAGKIIAGQENTGRLYIFDNGGFISSPFVGVNIEDIDLITPNENFFGVNFGTGRLLGAPAADFAGLVGDILLTQEFHGGTSGLFALSWNGVSLVVEQVTLSGGSAFAGQWEHVTFSSAGIVEIPPTDPNPIPEPATIVLLGVGAVAALRRRRKAA
ncbi:MAG: PEP-CTERM sorting domain-containing protein, partial [Planctomycetota bacterium]|nr:PEP-CTERM sorting domain-containing protein [Planctomycetota bacterium]